MRYLKTLYFLFSLLSVFCVHKINAQALNINGDTIFVNREAEIQIVFPTVPKSFNTIPESTQYRIWSTKSGINLIADAENYDPATLVVSEGERSHRFILIFKRDISNKEAKLYYDYSTIKKLDQHIRTTPAIRPISSEKIIVKTEPDKQDNTNGVASTTAVVVDSSLSYYALLGQGDKEIQSQNYQAAALTFNKAHMLRPEDKFPLQRLDEIKIKTTETVKALPQESDNNYKSLTAEAFNYLDQQKYTQAQQAYQRALELRPGDAYVTSQLQTLNTYLIRASYKKPVIREAASKDISTENLTPASKDVAAQFRKDNVVTAPKANVAQVEKNEQTLYTRQLAESNYNNTINTADSLFKAGSYDSAKTAYNKALGIAKKDWPRDQVNKINKIQSDQIAQANADKQKLADQQKIAMQLKQQKFATEERLRSDSIVAAQADVKRKYNIALSKAKASYAKNDLINARTFYEEASDLMPSQQEPQAQLKIINDKLSFVPADTSGIETEYDRGITVADSLVNIKSYEAAITAYRQASEKDPTQSYPWKQIKYLQSELVLIAKKKREDDERRFSDAIVRADKAVVDKKYDDAKSAYSEALSIHADNEYAQRRLAIINYQLEKAKVEKARQDSLNVIPEIPVKKSKRKK